MTFYLAILCVPVQGFSLDRFDSLRMDLGSILRNKSARSWVCTGDAKSAGRLSCSMWCVVPWEGVLASVW
jgi:hypothetical protein